MKSNTELSAYEGYAYRYNKALKLCELARKNEDLDLSLPLYTNAWELVISGNQDLGVDNDEDKIIDFLLQVCIHDGAGDIAHLLLNQEYESTKTLLKYSEAFHLSGQVSKTFYQKDTTTLNADGTIKNTVNYKVNGNFFNLLTILVVRINAIFKQFFLGKCDLDVNVVAAKKIIEILLPSIIKIALEKKIYTEGNSHRASLLFS